MSWRRKEEQLSNPIRRKKIVCESNIYIYIYINCNSK